MLELLLLTNFLLLFARFVSGDEFYDHRAVALSMDIPPPEMSSLTFVFDRTGSMNDDLVQVRHGAKGIFDTVMKQRKKLIYNYVLVLFHDPGALAIRLLTYLCRRRPTVCDHRPRCFPTRARFSFCSRRWRLSRNVSFR
jgi:hypothetical protein